MKTLFKYTISMLLMTLVAFSSYGQKDNGVRIKILKKGDGKTEVIDTIIHFPGDSVIAFWANADQKMMDRKTDSIMRIVHKKMKKINMDSVMQEVEKKLEHMDMQLRKINDSVIEHSLKYVMPKLKSLDSMNIHLPDMEDINESIQEGMKHAHFFIMDDDFEWESEDESEIRYIDGKIIKIKTDKNGNIKKAIIMSHDGENVEVKEGAEAYKFVTEEGEEIIIVSKKESKGVDQAEKKISDEKGNMDKGKNQ